MIRDFDELRDIAIRMVDNLVEQGFIKDCTDEPDDSTEFDVQDLLIETLIDSLKQDDCLTPTGMSWGAVELKEINEDYLSHSVDIYDLERRMYEIQGRKNCDPTTYPIVQLRGL